MEDFLKEEVRNDFLVDTKRKKLWNVFIGLYFELKRVCDKYNLKIFASGGTLLGAIRHDGFIPWDDDFDVAMSRADFTKLCEVAEKEFKDPLFFQYALSDRNYFIGIARLRKSDTTGIVTFLSNHKYNNGMYLDIYVYDKIPDNQKQLNRVIRQVKIYSTLLDNYYHYNNTNKKLAIFRPLFSVTKFFVSYEKLYKKYLSICTKYNEREDCHRLGFLCMPYFIKYEETIEGINNLIPHKFEYFDILIPSDWDSCLRKSYGDYMVFPPVEKRGKWHDGIIIYDPETPYIEYYKKHKDRFIKVLKEYEIEID